MEPDALQPVSEECFPLWTEPCRLLATTWEWKEDIDEQRAQEAKKRAEEMIAKGGLTDHDYKMAEAKLQRALVRLSVKNWIE